MACNISSNSFSNVDFIPNSEVTYSHDKDWI